MMIPPFADPFIEFNFSGCLICCLTSYLAKDVPKKEIDWKN